MSAKVAKVGVTERGDPALDHSWIPWVRDGNPAVLITKNCNVVEKLLDDMLSPNVIVHCNITGWGGSELEPNVPESSITLNSYRSLCDKFGGDRIVLRIDPIIPNTAGLEQARLINIHKRGRVRISFLDAYDHIRPKFKELGIPLHYGFHAPFDIRQEIWEYFGKPEVCAEPGLPSTGCISEKDCNILGVEPTHTLKGQRPLCLCLSNKFELLTKKEPCGHGCIYCYWKGVKNE